MVGPGKPDEGARGDEGVVLATGIHVSFNTVTKVLPYAAVDWNGAKGPFLHFEWCVCVVVVRPGCRQL